jgi:hypothetical protein
MVNHIVDAHGCLFHADPPYSFDLPATSQQYFLSEQTNHQQSANNTFLSNQISTSHQPPAKTNRLKPEQPVQP